jgi:hypothetical protein
MIKEGRLSKVAICENCNKMVMACHIGHLSKSTEKEFTELSNEGFMVKTETIEETQARKLGEYIKCLRGSCTRA